MTTTQTYQIAQMVDGQPIETRTGDITAWAAVAGVEITGTNQNKAQRAELQGQPKLKGFCGPMWNGNGILRYEDLAAYDYFSA